MDFIKILGKDEYNISLALKIVLNSIQYFDLMLILFQIDTT